MEHWRLKWLHLEVKKEAKRRKIECLTSKAIWEKSKENLVWGRKGVKRIKKILESRKI